MSRVPHEVIDVAVKEAIATVKEHDINAFSDADTWCAMYQGQCAATDQLAKIAERRSDRTLSARIKELEAQIVSLNQIIVHKNMQIDVLNLHLLGRKGFV